MTINEKQQLTRAGSKYAVLCALIGLLVACVITAIIAAVFGVGFHEVLFAGGKPILFATLALFGTAYVLGRLLGRVVYRVGLRSLMTPLMSIILAFACLTIATLVGLLSDFGNNPSGTDSAGTIMNGLALIVGVGSLPALILGLSFSAMMQSSARSDKSPERTR